MALCRTHDRSLNKDIILDILSHGHTRVPVYSGETTNITAILFCKDLLGIGFERQAPLKEVLSSFRASQRVVRVGRSTRLNVAMDHCKRTRQHLLCIVEDGVGAAPTPAPAAAYSKGAKEKDVRKSESVPAPVRPDAPVIGLATMEDFIEVRTSAE